MLCCETNKRAMAVLYHVGLHTHRRQGCDFAQSVGLRTSEILDRGANISVLINDHLSPGSRGTITWQSIISESSGPTFEHF